jgi:hypothetical protein
VKELSRKKMARLSTQGTRNALEGLLSMAVLSKQEAERMLFSNGRMRQAHGKIHEDRP